MSLYFTHENAYFKMYLINNCVTDLPQSTSLSKPGGHNSGSSSLLFRQLAGPWEGGWWLIPFTITAALGLGDPGGYLALPGEAALLGRPLFCRLYFVYGDYQNLFLLSFLLVAFAVDCLWRCRVKYWSIARGFEFSIPSPPGGSELIISVGDYVDNSFAALGSSDPGKLGSSSS